MGNNFIFKTANLYFYLVILFILALLISPFITPSNIMNPFLNGSKLWLYGISGIMLLFTALRLLTVNRRHFASAKLSVPDILVLFILLFILLKRCFLHDSVFFTDKVVEYICLTLVYLMLRFYVFSLSESRLQRFTSIFIGIIIIVTFVSCCYGLLQLYGVLPTNNPDFKVTGHFYNPARYANYLIALLPFCISAYFLFPKHSKCYLLVKYAAATVSSIGLLVLPVTYTRAAWLGILAGLGVVLYYRYKVVAFKLFRNIWLMISMLVLIGSMAFLLFKLKPASAYGRLTIWEVSIGIVKENPLTGIGYGAFEGGYGNYQAKYFEANLHNEQKVQGADVVRYAYNVFLQILAEQGLIGLTLFLLLLYFLIPKNVSIEKSDNNYRDFLTVSVLSSIISILVCGQSSYPFDVLPVSIVFFISIGLLAGVSRFTLQPKKKLLTSCVSVGSKVYTSKLFPILLLISASMIFYTLKQKYSAYKAWMELTYHSNSTELAVIYPILKNDIDFLNSYSQKLLNEKEYKKVIEVLESAKQKLMYPNFYFSLAQAYIVTNQLTKAENSYKTASYMIPNRFYSKYLWVKFYYDTKQFDKAINLSKNILTMKVKIPSQAVDEIKQKTQAILEKCNKN